MIRDERLGEFEDAGDASGSGALLPDPQAPVAREARNDEPVDRDRDPGLDLGADPDANLPPAEIAQDRPDADGEAEPGTELGALLRGLLRDEEAPTMASLQAEISSLRREIRDREPLESVVHDLLEKSFEPLRRNLQADMARLLAANERGPAPPSPAELRAQVMSAVTEQLIAARGTLARQMAPLVARKLLTEILDRLEREPLRLAPALAATLEACRRNPETRESRRVRVAVAHLHAPPPEPTEKPASPSREGPSPLDRVAVDEARPGLSSGSDRGPAAGRPTRATSSGREPGSEGKPRTGSWRAASTPRKPSPAKSRPALPPTGRFGSIWHRLAPWAGRRAAHAEADGTPVYHRNLPGRILHAALLETDTGRLLVETTPPGEPRPPATTTRERLDAVRREILCALVEDSSRRACEVSHEDETVHVAMRDRLYLTVVMIGRPPARFHVALQKLLDKIYRRAARQWQPIDQSSAMRASVRHSLERFIIHSTAPRRRFLFW